MNMYTFLSYIGTGDSPDVSHEIFPGKAVKLDESNKLNRASSQRSKWWLNLPYVLVSI